MNLTHIRTENGIATPITTRAALDEINAGMMDKAVKRTIRSMSAARSNANIEYRDGRLVTIKLATPEEIAEHTNPDVSTRELANEIGVSCDNIHDAASDLASEWFAEHGHRAVFRTMVGNDFGLSAAAAVEIRKRVKPEATTTDGRRMPAGSRIVTAKGKRYVVSPIRPARPRTPGATSWTPQAYVSYWAERDGRDTGATYSATASSKPGTVGAAIWEAANNTNN